MRLTRAAVWCVRRRWVDMEVYMYRLLLEVSPLFTFLPSTPLTDSIASAHSITASWRGTTRTRRRWTCEERGLELPVEQLFVGSLSPPFVVLCHYVSVCICIALSRKDPGSLRERERQGRVATFWPRPPTDSRGSETPSAPFHRPPPSAPHGCRPPVHRAVPEQCRRRADVRVCAPLVACARRVAPRPLRGSARASQPPRAGQARGPRP